MEYIHVNYPETKTNLRLRTLVLDRCGTTEKGSYDVYVHARNLKTFKYSGRLTTFHLDLSIHLEEADLDFCFEDEDVEDVGQYLQDVLHAFDTVEKLTVCSYILQVLPTNEEPYEKQSKMNATHLTLKTGVQESETWGIAFMLDSCDFVKTLIIEICTPKTLKISEPVFQGKRFVGYHDDCWDTECIRSTLRTLIVRGFKGDGLELLLLETIMKYGEVLQEVHIHVSDESEQEKEARRIKAESVRNFEKASEDVNVVIY